MTTGRIRGNVSVTVADSGFMKISEDKKFMIMTLFDGENAVDENPRENRRTPKIYLPQKPIFMNKL